jgi:RNA polymerase sigma-70 factor (ECF subfamily)
MRGFDSKVSALFVRHREDLLRYVARYAGDADLAEDVVQETFVRLRERPPLHQLRLRGWLYTVATNLARDALAISRRRRQLECSAALDLPMPNAAPDPATAAELEDLRSRVREAMDSLTHEERTALLMYQEGFRHREIAEAVDKRTEAVGSMIVRAARKVAAAIRTEAKP